MKILFLNLVLLVSASAAHAESLACVFNSSVSGVQEKVTKALDLSSSFNISLTLNGLDKGHFASVHLDGFISRDGNNWFNLNMDIWEPSKPASRRSSTRTVALEVNKIGGNLVFVTDTGEEYTLSCAGQ